MRGSAPASASARSETTREPVSVVIPAFNAQDTIGRAIDSVLAQSVPCRIIVVDDGSTDGTAGAVARFGGDLCLVSQANGGAAAARNAGVLVASSTYVAFLDADDEWLPHKMERQLSFCQAHPDVALLGCGAEYVDEGNRVVDRTAPGPRSAQLEPLLFVNRIVTSGVVVRRSALAELDGPFHAQFASGQDWHLWLRLAARFPCSMLPDALVRYRVRSASLSRKHPPDFYRKLWGGIYEDLRTDPAAGPVVRALWPSLQQNLAMMLAFAHYERGDPRGAYAEVLRAILVDPLHFRWRTLTFMVPRALRLRLRAAWRRV
jgi:glycosyltransferase involved in cell wall biosynthesis